MNSQSHIPYYNDFCGNYTPPPTVSNSWMPNSHPYQQQQQRNSPAPDPYMMNWNNGSYDPYSQQQQQQMYYLYHQHQMNTMQGAPAGRTVPPPMNMYNDSYSHHYVPNYHYSPMNQYGNMPYRNSNPYHRNITKPQKYDFSEVIPGSPVEPVRSVPAHILEIINLPPQLSSKDPLLEEICKHGAVLKHISPKGPLLAIFKSISSAKLCLTNFSDRPICAVTAWAGNLTRK